MTEKSKFKNNKKQSIENTDDVELIFNPQINRCGDVVEDAIQEALSVAQRIKKKHQMRRYKSRMKIARRRSMKRKATNARIKRRAQRQAVTNMKRRLAGGKSMSQLSYSSRARVERLAQRRKNAIKRQARRLVMVKRATERSRMANR